MFRRTFLLTAGSAAALLSRVGQALADDQDDAEGLALSCVTAVTDGDMGAFYQAKTTPAFRNMISQADFAQSIGVLRIKLGGPPRVRPVIQGSQKTSLDPFNRRGEFYFVRIRANYTLGSLLWDIWLEKFTGEWRVAGLNYFQVPPT